MVLGLGDLLGQGMVPLLELVPQLDVQLEQVDQQALELELVLELDEELEQDDQLELELHEELVLDVALELDKDHHRNHSHHRLHIVQ